MSSTFIDLKEHRAHVISSLRRAGFYVDPMEDWTAESEPKKFSQDRLDGCDLGVLLVAFRRGYVPDGARSAGLFVTPVRRVLSKTVPSLSNDK